MKSSFQRSERKSVRRLALATALVLFLLLGDMLGGGVFREAARNVAASIFAVGGDLGGSISGSGFFSTRRALIAENEALRNEIVSLQLRAAEVASLQSELESLRTLVHLAENEPGITAPVVSSFRTSPYGTFSIGGGRAAGIEEGDLVLAGSGESSFVLGVIREAGEHVSLGTLVFAPGVETAALLGGAEVVIGGRGGNGRAEVPASLQVGDGDLVEAPSFGGRPIGIVGGIQEESGGASKEIFVRFPVNLETIQFVYVVPQGK